jgi:hypothetical protein
VAIILRPFAIGAIFVFGVVLGLMAGEGVQGCHGTGPAPPQLQSRPPVPGR